MSALQLSSFLKQYTCGMALSGSRATASAAVAAGSERERECAAPLAAELARRLLHVLVGTGHAELHGLNHVDYVANSLLLLKMLMQKKMLAQQSTTRSAQRRHASAQTRISAGAAVVDRVLFFLDALLILNLQLHSRQRPQQQQQQQRQHTVALVPLLSTLIIH